MSASRRKQTIVGLVLLLAAFVLHGAASEETRRGIVPPSQGDAPGREDEFFGEDPREFALRPENQARLAAARNLEGLALAVAGCGAFILVFSLLAKRRGSFRDVASPDGAGTTYDRTGDSVTRPAGPSDDPPAAPS